MTARFLALYETPADPGAFDRHHRQIHFPLLASGSCPAWLYLVSVPLSSA
jgi:hypothetical protein